MDTTLLTHPIVKAALVALNNTDSKAWFAQFAPNVVLTDDGNPHDFNAWSNGELFKSGGKSYLKSVDRVEDGGLTVYGVFHSAQWGEFNTLLKFKVNDDKIVQLDVGQA
ncbi:MAG: hypothetical protein ACOYL5_09410 [Phototrophicaceae bacterium]